MKTLSVGKIKMHFKDIVEQIKHGNELLSVRAVGGVARPQHSARWSLAGRRCVLEPIPVLSQIGSKKTPSHAFLCEPCELERLKGAGERYSIFFSNCLLFNIQH